MITVAECSNVDEALMIKSMLAGNGIEALVPDEFTAQNAPPYLFAGRGVRVQVHEEDAKTAREIIASLESDAS